MAVPARRVSSARRDKRRKSVWVASAPTMVKCKNCGEYTLSHTVCPSCGYYDGKQVIAVDDD